MKSLQGNRSHKLIIVTGASRGLGQAITERLVERGEEVIGLARNTSGMSINAIECDVSDYASVNRRKGLLLTLC